MKNLKKFLLIVAVVLCLVLVLVACDEENPSTPVETPPVEETPVETPEDTVPDTNPVHPGVPEIPDFDVDITETPEAPKEEEVALPNVFNFERYGNGYKIIEATIYNGEVQIPSTYADGAVVAIGERVFRENQEITEVTVPSSIVEICDYAFSSCYALTTVRFENGSNLAKIGAHAFYGNEKLNAINLPETLLSIGEGAFQNCLDLTQIVVPSSVTSIGSDALDCTYYRSLTDTGVVYFGKVAYGFKPSAEQALTAITIKEGTVGIAGAAFYGNEYITAVSIPASVNNVGDRAFTSMPKLTSLTVNSANTVYSAVNGGLYLRAEKKLLFTTLNTVIAEDTLVIASGAYENSAYTGEIVIPNSVETIEASAFEGASITKVTLSTALTIIEKNVFLDCAGLVEITISSGIVEIKSGAFNGCVSLEKVTVESEEIVEQMNQRLDLAGLTQYATTVYLIEGLRVESNFLNAHAELVTSDKTGYLKYNIL